jgi:hypothetical protein
MKHKYSLEIDNMMSDTNISKAIDKKSSTVYVKSERQDLNGEGILAIQIQSNPDPFSLSQHLPVVKSQS